MHTSARFVKNRASASPLEHCGGFGLNTDRTVQGETDAGKQHVLLLGETLMKLADAILGIFLCLSGMLFIYGGAVFPGVFSLMLGVGIISFSKKY